jgi:hypothetical protein
MTNYEVIKTELNTEVLKKTDLDGKVWWVPMDESNSDYQRYLRWLEDPEAEENGTIS